MIYLIIGLLAVAYFYYDYYWRRGIYPPGPIPFPILGTSYMMLYENPQVTFDKLSRQYGSIFTVWLGPEPLIVITDYNILKRYVGAGKDASSFSGRPKFIHLVQHYYKGRHGIITLDGEEWKEQKRFCLYALRNMGFGRNIMETKVLAEVDCLIGKLEMELKEDVVGVVDMEGPIKACVGSIITSVIMGQRYDQEDLRFTRVNHLVDALFGMHAAFEALLLGRYAWLQYFPWFSGFLRNMIAYRDEMADFINKEIDAHKSSLAQNEEASDLIDAYLLEIKRREESGEELGHFSEHQLAMAIMDLWAGGLETTATTLRWALIFMANYPHVQQKVYDEISAYYRGKKKRAISMADRASLPYTAATVMEIQRYGNIIPANMPHRTTRDVVMEDLPQSGTGKSPSKILIPANSAVILQIASIHMNPEVFPDPHTFKPERFLSGGKVKSVEELIPFSIGKRQCIGESLARIELFLIFSSLVRQFKFSVPPGTRGNISEEFKAGVTNTPVKHKLLVKRRALD